MAAGATILPVPPSNQGGGGQTVVQPDLVSVRDVALAAGVGYSLGVDASGAIQVWGTGMAGSKPVGANVKAVGAARWGQLGGLASGDLLYWGNDAAGALSHASAVSLSGLGQWRPCEPVVRVRMPAWWP